MRACACVCYAGSRMSLYMLPELWAAIKKILTSTRLSFFQVFSSLISCYRIEIPFKFHMLHSGLVHGLAFWFDVAFIGTQMTVWLSTAPTEPLTHWYQVRCLLQSPLFTKAGDTLSGTAVLNANKRQSYDISILAQVDQTGSKSSNVLDLKNPFFRYTGTTPSPPPGSHYASPSETMWNTSSSYNLSSGLAVSGTVHSSSLSGPQNISNFNSDPRI